MPNPLKANYSTKRKNLRNAIEIGLALRIVISVAWKFTLMRTRNLATVG
jgi:hypothetical protein